jgi:hypothetical protein
MMRWLWRIRDDLKSEILDDEVKTVLFESGFFVACCDRFFVEIEQFVSFYQISIHKIKHINKGICFGTFLAY